MADLLKNEGIAVLISSPYRRAIQTIEGLAGILGADMIIEEVFRERRLSEKPVDDFDSAIAKVWEDDSFAWEGGESNRAAQNRGVRALTNVLEQYEGKSVAIGTHGNMMVLIINRWDNKYDFAFWRQLDMPDIYMLSFDKRRLVEVKRSTGQGRLAYFYRKAPPSLLFRGKHPSQRDPPISSRSSHLMTVTRSCPSSMSGLAPFL